jgi:hypothetical protein
VAPAADEVRTARGGSSSVSHVAHSGVASGHRVAKRHPGSMSTSRGGVPGIDWRYLVFRVASGSDRRSEIVYG